MGFRPRLRAPSPALVIAVIALFVALGGAAYAALGKNEVKSRNIAPKAVTGSDIASNAVKSSKINAAAVNASKLAGGAVDAGAIADGAVTRTKIKAQAVTTPKLADGAVEEAKLGDGAVTAAKLGPGSVTGAAALASLTVSVDPADTDGDCVEATAAVSGVTANDQVLVTAPPGLPVGMIPSGEAGNGSVDVRVCTIEAAVVPASDFNVLVIG